MSAGVGANQRHNYHLPTGQAEPFNFTLAFMKHPHSLQDAVGLKNLSQLLQISNLACAVFWSTTIITALHNLDPVLLVDDSATKENLHPNSNLRRRQALEQEKPIGRCLHPAPKTAKAGEE